MKIRNKILALGALAIGSLVFVLAEQMYRSSQASDTEMALKAAIDRAEAVSDLVHHLQRERGRTAAWLGERTPVNLDLLREQQAQTDQALGRLHAGAGGWAEREAMLGGLVHPPHQDTASLAAELAAERKRTAEAGQGFAEAFAFYSQHVQSFIDNTDQLAKVVPTLDVKDRLLAHAHILSAKEALGQTRALLAEALSRGTLSEAVFVALAERKSLFDEYSRKFALDASPDLAAHYRQALESGPARETRAVVDGLLTDLRPGKARMSAADWFDTATGAVDALKGVEDRSLAAIRREAEVAAAEIGQQVLMWSLLSVGMAALILVLAGSTVVGMLRAIGRLLSAVEHIISTKDFTSRIPPAPEEEIATLSRGFNELLNTADRLIKEKDFLANTDPLTGVNNRLKFMQVLHAELRRRQRRDLPMALVMFDIDHFKRVNDAYGHPAGDAVLKRIANIVVRNVRTTDSFARWGGEEFILLLPDDDAGQAIKAAEKLRGLIAGSESDDAPPVTASFGIATYRRDDDEASLCKRADEALYRAKHAGRNRVVCADVDIGANGAPARPAPAQLAVP